jgi:hypothetical protein
VKATAASTLSPCIPGGRTARPSMYTTSRGWTSTPARAATPATRPTGVSSPPTMRSTLLDPCLDAEPGYEDMADGIVNLDGGYLDDWDARKAHIGRCLPARTATPMAAIPSGRCGIGGGTNDLRAAALVRGHASAGLRPDAARQGAALVAPVPLAYPGPIADRVGSGRGDAAHPGHARQRRAATPWSTSRPAPSSGRARLKLDLTNLAGEQVAAWWYDPRTGSPAAWAHAQAGAHDLHSRSQGGPDWVLVLDDAAVRFPGDRGA